MKKYILFIFIISAVATVLVSCKKAVDDITPYNDKTDTELLQNIVGLTTATNGNYSLLVTSNTGNKTYADTWWNLSELKGNNLMAVTQAYPQTRSDSYAYVNSPPQSISPQFWTTSYRIVFGTNKIIEAIKSGQSAATDQLKGENYFLRAMAYFNMVRVYGRPYYQNNGGNLAVPLSLSSNVDASYKPARNSVTEVYASIVSDLQNAANLMTQPRGNYYASREAAWALLSRVYLYMGGTPGSPQIAFNTKAATYADSVINSGKFTLQQGANYTNFYNADGSANSEMIFIFKHDAANGNTINDYVVPTNVYGNPYQGEYAVSTDYLNLVNQNPADIRNSFMFLTTDSRMTTPSKQRYTITKYNYSQIYAPGGFNFTTQSRSATPYLRLAEMYLNKAEALAKTGDNVNALIAINVVRTRAGAPAWTTTTLGLAGMSVFQAALNERRLELAWEGHSAFDNFRNGLPVIRNYSDYSAPSLNISATDNGVVSPLPPNEILLNPNLVQNP